MAYTLRIDSTSENVITQARSTSENENSVVSA